MLHTSLRTQYPVLVPEAGAVGAIGVIRSLGRAGYRVHACASDPDALGLHSNYVSATIVCPPYSDKSFLPWLRTYLEKHHIRVIVPSEGFMLAIEPQFEELLPLIPITRDKSAVYRCFSKVETFRALLKAPPETGVAKYIPPSLIVSEPSEIPTVETLEQMGGPFFVKCDASHARNGANSRLYRICCSEETVARTREALETYRSVLVQGWAGGRKAGANFCIHNGEILAESMVLSHHTNPHTGGMMSLRRSWRHEGLRADALTKIQYLGWEGVAMMEYKWIEKTDDFYLIEMNARYWGFLHLDLFSGVDYPTIQVDRFLRHPTRLPVQRRGVVCRHTVPGEVGYVLSRIRDRDVSFVSKLWTVIEFVLLFFNPFIRSDLLFPGDRKLYWLQWKQFLISLFQTK